MSNPNKRSAEEISAMISDWQTSGLSKKQFCLQKEINYQTFIGWMIQRRNRSAREKKFIPLEVEPQPKGIFAEIHLSAAKKIILHYPVSADFIQVIIKC